MSHLHIPPVSFEDLQTFQEKHFPTTITPNFLQPGSQAQSEAQTTYTYENNEDDLGYYPDGVKRTLTDDQIRIFRHSEIHALLRERQVRAENEEFERKFGVGPEKEPEDEKVASFPKRTDAQSNLTVKEDVKGTGAGIKRSAEETGSNKHGVKRKSVAYNNKDESVRLDYNEEKGVASKPNVSRAQVAAQFSGRRIISYDD
ncbi:hypothetical protein BDV12DRAFT_152685 [Aspergillus spectabilis]